MKAGLPKISLFWHFFSSHPKIREDPQDLTSNYGDNGKDHGLSSITTMYHRT